MRGCSKSRAGGRRRERGRSGKGKREWGGEWTANEGETKRTVVNGRTFEITVLIFAGCDDFLRSCLVSSSLLLLGNLSQCAIQIHQFTSLNFTSPKFDPIARPNRLFASFIQSPARHLTLLPRVSRDWSPSPPLLPSSAASETVTRDIHQIGAPRRFTSPHERNRTQKTHKFSFTWNI